MLVVLFSTIVVIPTKLCCYILYYYFYSFIAEQTKTEARFNIIVSRICWLCVHFRLLKYRYLTSSNKNFIHLSVCLLAPPPPAYLSVCLSSTSNFSLIYKQIVLTYMILIT